MKNFNLTFHESYGYLPNYLIRKYRSHNVSPLDHDRLLNALGYTWDDAFEPASDVIDWYRVDELVNLHSPNGYLALPYDL